MAWLAFQTADGSWSVQTKSGLPIADMLTESEARLMAAAPRMLWALEKADPILRAYIPADTYDGHCSDAQVAVSEAIAAAHGKLVTLKRRDA